MERRERKGSTGLDSGDNDEEEHFRDRTCAPLKCGRPIGICLKFDHMHEAPTSDDWNVSDLSSRRGAWTACSAGECLRALQADAMASTLLQTKIGHLRRLERYTRSRGRACQQLYDL